MAVDVTAEVRRQDISALMRQMRRNAEAFGRSVPSSVKFAAWAVADALRAATKIAPKYHDIEEIKSLRQFSRVGEDKIYGDRTYDITQYSRGRTRVFRVTAPGRREVKKMPVAQIQLRGLAAKAWHLAQRKLGSGRGGAKVSPRASEKATRYGMVSMNLGGNNPSVTITNKLNYASQAFKSDGEQTISNVMERAASRMAHIIDGKLKKKLQAA
jgi:hypothetical protein